ncbi:DUF732 domain-containing protein [Actinomadura scrupuli]|uniref:DUF732 domain-containing protein n=1 Tax=Actinomadura scrupuli TaxID=559629 RepID=UPI003D98E5FC
MRVIVSTSAALLVLCGCGVQDPAAEPASPATAAVKAKPPTPTVDSDGDFLAALIALDAGLTLDRDRALIRAWDVCLDIKQGKDAAAVVKNAQVRFTDGHVTVNPEQAKVIVAAAKKYIC